MKVCDLISGVGRLQKSTTRLKERWLDAKQHWQDGNAKQFQEEHLQPLGPQITLAAAAIHRLSEVLEKAERELESRSDITISNGKVAIANAN